MKIYYKKRHFDKSLQLPDGYQVWYLPIDEHHVGVSPDGLISMGFYEDYYAARRWCLAHHGGFTSQVHKDWSTAEKLPFTGSDDLPIPYGLTISIKSPMIDAQIKCDGKKMPTFDQIRGEIIAGVFEAVGFSKKKTALVLRMSTHTVHKILSQKYRSNGPDLFKKIQDLKNKADLAKEKPYRAPEWELKS